jgi:ATP-dependent DNA helicase RecG
VTSPKHQAPNDTSALAALNEWIAKPEAERLEFKEAKNNFHVERLAKYCAALSNEGGGTIILGVTDRRPRRVVGTAAFEEPGRTVAGLCDRLRIRVTADEIHHPDGRVLAFHAPPRPIGMPIQFEGIYWGRAGDELRPLTADELRRVFDEAGPDFSAELNRSATLADLDPALIERFREMWIRKSGNDTLLGLTSHQLLEDAELVRDGHVTNAALILVGRSKGLGQHLAQAEVIFEYRSSDASVPFQQRLEFRRGFIGYLDELWQAISLRNDVLHYQQGFFSYEIPVLNESVVREAILNAIAHRDYRLGGSIFVRQYPRRLEVTSPGGFPSGITANNLLWRQLPRNRRIAEACAKCGLVERSGQGANRMYEESIKEGKPQPSFAGTDDFQVVLTLKGEIQNPDFLRFIEKIGRERLSSFTTEDLLVLDSIQREETIHEALKERLAHLAGEGIIERVGGRGRGGRFILSRSLYSFIGKRGVYTRARGLDRETNKALLLRHIDQNASEGSIYQDLQQVLPTQSRNQIQRLLQELKSEQRVRVIGTRRYARWYPASGSH